MEITDLVHSITLTNEDIKEKYNGFSSSINYKLMLYVASILMGISACTKPITTGEVYEKSYDSAHNYVRLIAIPHTTRAGKVNVTRYTYSPMMMHDDEDFIIKIRSYGSESKKERTRLVYVDKACFDTISVGDCYNCNSNSRFEDKDTKLRKATEEEAKQNNLK